MIDSLAVLILVFGRFVIKCQFSYKGECLPKTYILFLTYFFTLKAQFWVDSKFTGVCLRGIRLQKVESDTMLRMSYLKSDTLIKKSSGHIRVAES